MLKDTFYTILERLIDDRNSLSYQIKLNGSHPIYSGHFPGNPVTPGVVQMEIVKELLADHMNKEMKLLAMSNCKFLAVLSPDSNPVVAVNMSLSTLDDGNMRVTAQFVAEEQVFTKIQSVFYS